MEQQEQNQNEQPKAVEEKTPKIPSVIPTRLGSLLILLAAVAVIAGVRWYENSLVPPKGMDVSNIVRQMQAQRGIKSGEIAPDTSEQEVSNTEEVASSTEELSTEGLEEGVVSGECIEGDSEGCKVQ